MKHSRRSQYSKGVTTVGLIVCCVFALLVGLIMGTLLIPEPDKNSECAPITTGFTTQEWHPPYVCKEE